MPALYKTVVKVFWVKRLSKKDLVLELMGTKRKPGPAMQAINFFASKDLTLPSPLMRGVRNAGRGVLAGRLLGLYGRLRDSREVKEANDQLDLMLSGFLDRGCYIYPGTHIHFKTFIWRIGIEVSVTPTNPAGWGARHPEFAE